MPIAPSLAQQIKCNVLTDRGLQRFSSDFGASQVRTPSAVFLRPSNDDLSAILKHAAANNLQVSLRGSGHSCAGQTLNNGLVVNTSDNANPILAINEASVKVNAGATWGSVEAALRRKGRQIPILADHYGLSVGGTLAVGCYGADSLKWGALVHQVEALDLITGSGEQVSCTKTENADLFNAALAGLGGVGIIRSATIRTTRLQKYTTWHSYRCGSLSELAEIALGLPTEGVAAFKALHANGRYVANAGNHFDQWREALASPSPIKQKQTLRWSTPRYRSFRSLGVKLWVGRYSGTAKLWSDYLLDEHALITVCTFLDQALLNKHIANYIKAIYFLPVKRSPSAICLEGTGHLSGEMAYGLGIYAMAKRGSDTQPLRAFLREALEVAMGQGGKPYLYGHHDLSMGELASLYGDGWQDYTQAVNKWNPNQTLKVPLLERATTKSEAS